MTEVEKNHYLDRINTENYIDDIIMHCTKVLFNRFKLHPKNQALLNTIITATYDDNLFINSNFQNIRQITDNLYILFNSQEADAIRRAFYNLYEAPDFRRFICTIYDIYEEKLKYDYSTKLSQYYKPDGTFVDKDGINYANVVDISNEDFFLNIHNIHIGYANSANAHNVTNEPSKFVDKNFGNSNTISGSIISPNFIGVPIFCTKEDVYYGFNHLLKDDILAFGIEDMMTEWDVKKGKPSFEYYNALYTPDKISDHIKWKYSECVLWRDNQGNKRKPDYILCIDKINKTSLKHADHYNIPIYYINSLQVIKNKLTRLIQDFEKLRTSSINLYEFEIFLDKLRSFAYQLHSIEMFIDFDSEEWKKLIIKSEKLYKFSQNYIERVISNYVCDENNDVDKTRKAIILDKNKEYYPGEMFLSFNYQFEFSPGKMYYELPF